MSGLEFTGERIVHGVGSSLTRIGDRSGRGDV